MGAGMGSGTRGGAGWWTVAVVAVLGWDVSAYTMTCLSYNSDKELGLALNVKCEFARSCFYGRLYDRGDPSKKQRFPSGGCGNASDVSNRWSDEEGALNPEANYLAPGIFVHPDAITDEVRKIGFFCFYNQDLFQGIICHCFTDLCNSQTALDSIDPDKAVLVSKYDMFPDDHICDPSKPEKYAKCKYQLSSYPFRIYEHTVAGPVGFKRGTICPLKNGYTGTLTNILTYCAATCCPSPLQTSGKSGLTVVSCRFEDVECKDLKSRFVCPSALDKGLEKCFCMSGYHLDPYTTCNANFDKVDFSNETEVRFIEIPTKDEHGAANCLGRQGKIVRCPLGCCGAKYKVVKGTAKDPKQYKLLEPTDCPAQCPPQAQDKNYNTDDAPDHNIVCFPKPGDLIFCNQRPLLEPEHVAARGSVSCNGPNGQVVTCESGCCQSTYEDSGNQVEVQACPTDCHGKMDGMFPPDRYPCRRVGGNKYACQCRGNPRKPCNGAKIDPSYMVTSECKMAGGSVASCSSGCCSASFDLKTAKRTSYSPACPAACPKDLDGIRLRWVCKGETCTCRNLDNQPCNDVGSLEEPFRGFPTYNRAVACQTRTRGILACVSGCCGYTYDASSDVTPDDSCPTKCPSPMPSPSKTEPIAVCDTDSSPRRCACRPALGQENKPCNTHPEPTKIIYKDNLKCQVAGGKSERCDIGCCQVSADEDGNVVAGTQACPARCPTRLPGSDPDQWICISPTQKDCFCLNTDEQHPCNDATKVPNPRYLQQPPFFPSYQKCNDDKNQETTCPGTCCRTTFNKHWERVGGGCATTPCPYTGTRKYLCNKDGECVCRNTGSWPCNDDQKIDPHSVEIDKPQHLQCYVGTVGDVYKKADQRKHRECTSGCCQAVFDSSFDLVVAGDRCPLACPDFGTDEAWICDSPRSRSCICHNNFWDSSNFAECNKVSAIDPKEVRYRYVAKEEVGQCETSSGKIIECPNGCCAAVFDSSWTVKFKPDTCPTECPPPGVPWSCGPSFQAETTCVCRNIGPPCNKDDVKPPPTVPMKPPRPAICQNSHKGTFICPSGCCYLRLKGSAVEPVDYCPQTCPNGDPNDKKEPAVICRDELCTCRPTGSNDVCNTRVPKDSTHLADLTKCWTGNGKEGPCPSRCCRLDLDSSSSVADKSWSCATSCQLFTTTLKPWICYSPDQPNCVCRNSDSAKPCNGLAPGSTIPKDDIYYLHPRSTTNIKQCIWFTTMGERQHLPCESSGSQYCCKVRYGRPDPKATEGPERWLGDGCSKDPSECPVTKPTDPPFTCKGSKETCYCRNIDATECNAEEKAPDDPATVFPERNKACYVDGKTTVECNGCCLVTYDRDLKRVDGDKEVCPVACPAQDEPPFACTFIGDGKLACVCRNEKDKGECNKTPQLDPRYIPPSDTICETNQGTQECEIGCCSAVYEAATWKRVKLSDKCPSVCPAPNEEAKCSEDPTDPSRLICSCHNTGTGPCNAKPLVPGKTVLPEDPGQPGPMNVPEVPAMCQDADGMIIWCKEGCCFVDLDADGNNLGTAPSRCPSNCPSSSSVVCQGQRCKCSPQGESDVCNKEPKVDPAKILQLNGKCENGKGVEETCLSGCCEASLEVDGTVIPSSRGCARVCRSKGPPSLWHCAAPDQLDCTCTTTAAKTPCNSVDNVPDNKRFYQHPGKTHPVHECYVTTTTTKNCPGLCCKASFDPETRERIGMGGCADECPVAPDDPKYLCFDDTNDCVCRNLDDKVPCNNDKKPSKKDIKIVRPPYCEPANSGDPPLRCESGCCAAVFDSQFVKIASDKTCAPCPHLPPDKDWYCRQMVDGKQHCVCRNRRDKRRCNSEPKIEDPGKIDHGPPMVDKRTCKNSKGDDLVCENGCCGALFGKSDWKLIKALDKCPTMCPQSKDGKVSWLCKGSPSDALDHECSCSNIGSQPCNDVKSLPGPVDWAKPEPEPTACRMPDGTIRMCPMGCCFVHLTPTGTVDKKKIESECPLQCDDVHTNHDPPEVKVTCDKNIAAQTSGSTKCTCHSDKPEEPCNDKVKFEPDREVITPEDRICWDTVKSANVPCKQGCCYAQLEPKDFSIKSGGCAQACPSPTPPGKKWTCAAANQLDCTCHVTGAGKPCNKDKAKEDDIYYIDPRKDKDDVTLQRCYEGRSDSVVTCPNTHCCQAVYDRDNNRIDQTAGCATFCPVFPPRTPFLCFGRSPSTCICRNWDNNPCNINKREPKEHRPINVDPVEIPEADKICKDPKGSDLKCDSGCCSAVFTRDKPGQGFERKEAAPDCPDHCPQPYHPERPWTCVALDPGSRTGLSRFACTCANLDGRSRCNEVDHLDPDLVDVVPPALPPSSSCRSSPTAVIVCEEGCCAAEFSQEDYRRTAFSQTCPAVCPLLPPGEDGQTPFLCQNRFTDPLKCTCRNRQGQPACNDVAQLPPSSGFRKPRPPKLEFPSVICATDAKGGTHECSIGCCSIKLDDKGTNIGRDESLPCPTSCPPQLDPTVKNRPTVACADRSSLTCVCRPRADPDKTVCNNVEKVEPEDVVYQDELKCMDKGNEKQCPTGCCQASFDKDWKAVAGSDVCTPFCRSLVYYGPSTDKKPWHCVAPDQRDCVCLNLDPKTPCNKVDKVEEKDVFFLHPKLDTDRKCQGKDTNSVEDSCPTDCCWSQFNDKGDRIDGGCLKKEDPEAFCPVASPGKKYHCIDSAKKCVCRNVDSRQPCNHDDHVDETDYTIVTTKLGKCETPDGKTIDCYCCEATFDEGFKKKSVAKTCPSFCPPPDAYKGKPWLCVSPEDRRCKCQNKDPASSTACNSAGSINETDVTYEKPDPVTRPPVVTVHTTEQPVKPEKPVTAKPEPEPTSGPVSRGDQCLVKGSSKPQRCSSGCCGGLFQPDGKLVEHLGHCPVCLAITSTIPQPWSCLRLPETGKLRCTCHPSGNAPCNDVKSIDVKDPKVVYFLAPNPVVACLNSEGNLDFCDSGCCSATFDKDGKLSRVQEKCVESCGTGRNPVGGWICEKNGDEHECTCDANKAGPCNAVTEIPIQDEDALLPAPTYPDPRKCAVEDGTTVSCPKGCCSAKFSSDRKLDKSLGCAEYCENSEAGKGRAWFCRSLDDLTCTCPADKDAACNAAKELPPGQLRPVGGSSTCMLEQSGRKKVVCPVPCCPASLGSDGSVVGVGKECPAHCAYNFLPDKAWICTGEDRAHCFCLNTDPDKPCNEVGSIRDEDVGYQEEAQRRRKDRLESSSLARPLLPASLLLVFLPLVAYFFA